MSIFFKVKASTILCACLVGLSLASPAALAEDKSQLLMPMSDQVASVLKYCSTSDIEADKLTMQKAGFVNVVDGTPKAEMPREFMAFVKYFYDEAGKVSNFLIKENEGKYLVVIIDGNNTCNSAPFFGSLDQVSPLLASHQAEKVKESEQIKHGDVEIKTSLYKVKDKVFAISEISNASAGERLTSVTATRVY